MSDTEKLTSYPPQYQGYDSSSPYPQENYATYQPPSMQSQQSMNYPQIQSHQQPEHYDITITNTTDDTNKASDDVTSESSWDCKTLSTINFINLSLLLGILSYLIIAMIQITPHLNEDGCSAMKSSISITKVLIGVIGSYCIFLIGHLIYTIILSKSTRPSCIANRNSKFYGQLHLYTFVIFSILLCTFASIIAGLTFHAHYNISGPCTNNMYGLFGITIFLAALGIVIFTATLCNKDGEKLKWHNLLLLSLIALFSLLIVACIVLLAYGGGNITGCGATDTKKKEDNDTATTTST